MHQKSVAIAQSNYIPWKGYIDLIRSVDEFILYDDMQFTRRDWRNRNRIKTPKGPIWITIPVETKGKYLQKIKDTRVSDTSWPKLHWETIQRNYHRAEAYDEFGEFFEQLYLGEAMPEFLSEINFRFLTAICDLLEIRTDITWSMDYKLVEGKSDRLAELCRQAGGTEYVSGPAAKDYIDESVFAQAGITLTWMEYPDYPEYLQVHPPYEHGVSIVDLILNAGSRAGEYIKPIQS